MKQHKERRTHDPEMHPINRVIDYVGAIAILALIVAAGLYWNGKEGAAALAITGSCVTGLLALLGQTNRARSSEPMPVVNAPDTTLETTPATTEPVTGEPNGE